jgi:hypothetical protein
LDCYGLCSLPMGLAFEDGLCETGTLGISIELSANKTLVSSINSDLLHSFEVFFVIFFTRLEFFFVNFFTRFDFFKHSLELLITGLVVLSLGNSFTKTTLETSEELIKIHSKRVKNLSKYTRNEYGRSHIFKISLTLAFSCVVSFFKQISSFCKTTILLLAVALAMEADPEFSTRFECSFTSSPLVWSVVIYSL